MKPIHFLRLLPLLLVANMYGCAATAPASSSTSDEEDEYEGRLFSWKFDAEPDRAESAEQSPAASGGAEASNRSNAAATPPTRQASRIRYSAEDDENGDRGFIIHGPNDGDHE